MERISNAVRRAQGVLSEVLLGLLPPALLALVAVCWLAPAQAQQAPLEDLSAFPQAHLTIKGGGAVHEFSIWVADTPAREEQGLMFVRELAADRGMVFYDVQPRPWDMWMKNTFIPLDMLFIGADGRITQISHAVPHDETIIRSNGPVKAVIELQGGISDRLHLKAGDQAAWKPAP